MNRKERRAAQKGQGVRTPRMPIAVVAQTFAEAVGHRQAGDFQTADALCREILGSYPDHAGCLHLLGTMALQTGQFAPAAELLGRAIAIEGTIAPFHDDIGIALNALGRTSEAIAHHRKAISLDPQSGRSYNNLAIIMLQQGRPHEASEAFAKALVLTPELLDVYREIVATLFKVNPSGETAVARTEQAWPRRLSIDELFGANGISAVAADALLQRMLVSSPVRDVPLERMLTSVRAALLKSAVDENAGGADESDLAFRCALARQCFINEYVFSTTPEELETLNRAKALLAAAIGSKSAVPSRALAAVGSYVPLTMVPNAALLIDPAVYPAWPKPVDELLTTQLREPLEERRIQTTIPRLTAIEDPTSILVRAQYEENPYPRWVLPPTRHPPVPMDEYMRRQFPGAVLPEIGAREGVDILVAGCGTGQHPIAPAQRFIGARVLAVDLSLASLAYAQRKSREHHVDNITYAQADILKLGSIDRTFDLIDSSGVLHHLADPEAGWRVLLSLLRPRGLMRIALYSEAGRRDTLAARLLLEQRGYRPTPEDIRLARNELYETDLKTVARFNDFFSTSECRDMLFHVQEHLFTIARIRAFLEANALRFVGFHFRHSVLADYRRRFPQDHAGRVLANWEQYETEQPNTFDGMYQFWIARQ